ncbi:hypothetical protein WA026_013351 [Henosepilachna vigintioctopunctata]|uniref:Acyltransferase 3 domain-containing protein n=1 Tax=Henosepilachna vigintioctopunctata TaxID=420089 RepID=A0AAW1VEL2_9CUCU
MPKELFIEEYIEYKDNGLVGRVDRSFCYENISKLKISIYDICMGGAVTTYILFLVYCTVKTNNSKESNENKSSQKVNKYIKIFSFTNTWRNINKQNRGEDFDRLRSIQGIRTLTNGIVILTHNYIALTVTFSYNPEYVERLTTNSYTRLIINFFGLVVQTFFTISAWLLATQLNNIVKNNGKITMKDVLIIALNRYFRLIPAMALVILLHIIPVSVNVPSQLLYRSFWIWSNNWSCFNANFCNPGTWYLAVDTQLYIMVVLFFYLSQKSKIPMKYFLGLASMIAVSVQAYTLMNTTVDGLLKFVPKMLPGETTFARPEFLISYMGTECSLVTYVIGFMFGSIYVENKHRNMFDTRIKKVFWFVSFFGLPIITSLFYAYDSWRILETIRAITFRPLFSLGVAIGILGMATSAGGCIKKFFEWRPLVFMGNFSYSVYMFHFPMIFLKLSMKTTMIYFNHMDCIISVLQDLVLSFIIGILMYIIFEHPCLQLQKMFLPQVRRSKGESERKIN